MKKRLIKAFAASVFAACCNNGGAACDARNLDRAKATLDSIYAHYGVAENRLLRENYPFNVDYTASYLASADQARPNPYSYLWPFSGTLSAVNTILEADASYRSVLDGRVLPGLAEYLDTTRMPAAYASYINTASASDRFYDDNVWLGIDFCDIYEATGDKTTLAEAEKIWKFIESGTDDVLGGGIYWCEQQKHSKNTCSNAPGTVYALKLYAAKNSFIREIFWCDCDDHGTVCISGITCLIAHSVHCETTGFRGCIYNISARTHTKRINTSAICTLMGYFIAGCTK